MANRQLHLDVSYKVLRFLYHRLGNTVMVSDRYGGNIFCLDIYRQIQMAVQGNQIHLDILFIKSGVNNNC